MNIYCGDSTFGTVVASTPRASLRNCYG